VGGGDGVTITDLQGVIKDASDNVGGVILTDVAAGIEKFGKAGNIKALKEFFPELENEFDRLKNAMNDYFV